MPTFRWDPLSGPTTYYYAVKIMDYNQGFVWYMSAATTAPHTSVPASAELPWSSSYKWAVYAFDEAGFEAGKNMYISPYRTFTVYRANAPEAKRVYIGQAHNLGD